MRGTSVRSLHHSHSSLSIWHFLLRFRRLDRFIHRQNQTAGLGGRGDRVQLHHARLPDAGGQIVLDVLVEDVHAGPDRAGRVLLSQLVQDVGRIETGVVAQLLRYDLERLGDRTDHQLLLARHVARILPQVLGQLHLDRTAAGHDRVVLQCSSHDHDRIVQRTLGLRDELLGAATQNERDRFRVRTAGKQIVSEEERSRLVKFNLIAIESIQLVTDR